MSDTAIERYFQQHTGQPQAPQSTENGFSGPTSNASEIPLDKATKTALAMLGNMPHVLITVQPDGTPFLSMKGSPVEYRALLRVLFSEEQNFARLCRETLRNLEGEQAVQEVWALQSNRLPNSHKVMLEFIGAQDRPINEEESEFEK